MFITFERRICKSFWIGNSGMTEFDVFVTCGMIQIEILGYYVILPLPRRLTNKIENARAKRTIRKWDAERESPRGFTDVKTYPGEAKWTSNFTPPTEPY